MPSNLSKICALRLLSPRESAICSKVASGCLARYSSIIFNSTMAQYLYLGSGRVSSNIHTKTKSQFGQPASRLEKAAAAAIDQRFRCPSIILSTPNGYQIVVFQGYIMSLNFNLVLSCIIVKCALEPRDEPVAVVNVTTIVERDAVLAGYAGTVPLPGMLVSQSKCWYRRCLIMFNKARTASIRRGVMKTATLSPPMPPKSLLYAQLTWNAGLCYVRNGYFQTVSADFISANELN